MDLTDEQWKRLKKFFESRRKAKRGRPARHPREVINGILWILRTGAQWMHLPKIYPPYQTCHRWFQRWAKDGTLEQILTVLAKDLYERGGVDITECFIDGMFVPAKKGAPELAKLSGVRARRSWELQTVIVFLSPFAQTALKRMKSSLWKRQ
jgi:transposase